MTKGRQAAVTVAAAEVNAAATKISESARISKAQSLSKKPRRARNKGKREVRRIPVPPHRLRPLKRVWMEVYEPLVRQLKLQVRMNLRARAVELRNDRETTAVDSLQKGADFVQAVVLGFAPADALAVVRLDDLYVESFEVTDVRSVLKGDHLARAVGRIAGKDGRTKFTIENATRTRIVIADTKIHILGSFGNIKLARNAISSLILGTAPGKVYNRLRTVAARLNERF